MSNYHIVNHPTKLMRNITFLISFYPPYQRLKLFSGKEISIKSRILKTLKEPYAIAAPMSFAQLPTNHYHTLRAAQDLIHRATSQHFLEKAAFVPTHENHITSRGLCCFEDHTARFSLTF